MFRRIYIAVLALTLSSLAWAQNRSMDPTPLDRKSFHEKQVMQDAARSVADTPFVYFPTWNDQCSEFLTFFGITNFWGFVSGTNEFRDLAKAQQLEFTDGDSYSILGGFAFFSLASAIGDSSMTMNFHAVDPNDGAPGDMLASSFPIKTSDVVLPDSFINPTFFVIPPQDRPTINDPTFYASLHFPDLYDAMDTIALFQTDPEESCGDGTNTFTLQIDPNGTSDRDALADTSWVNILLAWNMNADFGLGAIVEFDPVASDEAFISTNGLTLYPSYPNPARKSITLNYEIDRSSTVYIDIFDVQGKSIQRIKEKQRQAGLHQLEIDLEGYAEGTYYYLITTDDGHIASRFTVQ